MFGPRYDWGPSLLALTFGVYNYGLLLDTWKLVRHGASRIVWKITKLTRENCISQPSVLLVVILKLLSLSSVEPEAPALSPGHLLLRRSSASETCRVWHCGCRRRTAGLWAVVPDLVFHRDPTVPDPNTFTEHGPVSYRCFISRVDQSTYVFLGLKFNYINW